MISRRSLLAAGLALVACAAAEPVPPRTPALSGVRRIALARFEERRAGAARAKDPLDALGESLAQRDVEARLVEADGEPALERLHGRVEARIATASEPIPGRFGRHVERLGMQAAEAVRALGVDAVAMYHRFDRPSAFPDVPPGTPFASRPTAGLRRPLGALSLVDADGNATWFDWGAPDSELDPSAPANAAEAIDHLLHVLAGEPPVE